MIVIALAGDFNQNIEHDEIQHFVRLNGLFDEVNGYDNEIRDRTYKNGRNRCSFSARSGAESY